MQLCLWLAKTIVTQLRVFTHWYAAADILLCTEKIV